MKTLRFAPLPRPSAWILTFLAGFALLPTAQAQYQYVESFSNTTAPGWISSQGDTTPGPRLTAGLTPGTYDPETGKPQIDADGQGWMRLATTTGNQANASYLNIALPAAGAKVTIDFDFAFWGGAANPGDGIAFFLANANSTFDSGAYGGSLGYAQKTAEPGLAGGYVGMGLDVYGNYINDQEGRVGGTVGATLYPNNVTVRGDAASSYAYNNSTVLSTVTQDMDFASYTSRPDQDSVDYRHAQMILNANNTYEIYLQFGYGTTPQLVLSGTLTGTRPDEFRLGFTSGTGGATQVYEVRNMEVQLDGGTNSNYWDDNNGNNAWGTAANWNNNTVPLTSADVYFTSSSFPDVDNPETVNLGANRTVGNVFFADSKAYTLTGNTLIFDAAGTRTTSRIQIFNSPDGNAAHTIASNIDVENDLQILHQISNTFTVSGGIDLRNAANTAGYNLLVDTVSETDLTGIVSGTAGTITKNGDGTLVMSGANTYTGATTINNGVLEIRNNTGLGTTAGATTVNTGGTLALSNNISSAEVLTINGTGESAAGAIHNLSGSNTLTGGITLGSNSSIDIDSGSTLTISTGTTAIGANTLTVINDGTATVSGLITGTGASTLVMDGTGTSTFSGNNTGFDGNVTIRSGTVRVTTSNNALGDASVITMGDSGTLASEDMSLLIDTGRDLSRNITVANQGNTTTIGGYSTGATTGTISGAITLNKTAQLTDASNGTTAGTTFSGVMSGTGGITKVGAGVVTLSGNNTFTGDVNVNTGTLRLGGNERIANTVAVTVASGATFDLANSTETIGSLAGAGSVSLGTSAGGDSLTVGGNNTSTTFSGVISGTVNKDLIKTGTGTMTLSGNNTFTGELQVNAGTVRVTAANVLADTSTLSLGGGTYSVAGVADTIGTFTMAASSRINYEGTSGGLQSFGAVTAGPTGTLTIDNWIGNPLTTSAASTTTGFFVDEASAATGGMTALAAQTVFTGWGTTSGWKTVTAGSRYELVPTIVAGAGVWRWDRDTNTTWATGTNWVGNPGAGPAAAGDLAYFGDDAPNNAQTPTITDGNKSLGTMIINGTGNRSYTFDATGGPRTLTLDQTGTGGTAYLTVSGTQANVIGSNNTAANRLNLALNNDALLIQNNSTATTGLTIGSVAGDHTLANNGQNITVMGSGGTVINSQVTGAGQLIMNGTGTLELTDANNTYSGGTTLNSGILRIGSNAALGTGTFTINGNTGAEIQATGAARTITNNLDIDNSATNTIKFTGSNDLTFGGTQTLSTTGTALTIDVASGRNLTFDTNMDLSGTGSVTKASAGTLTLRGNDSSFSGGLNVNAGTVTTGAAFDGAMTLGATVAGANYLGSGAINISGGTLTTFQNVTGGTTGYDLTARGQINNSGGTATFTNSRATEFDADTYLNGATINQSGGTTSFVDWNDLEVTGASTINVSGGTLNHTLTGSFNTATPNTNVLNINVSGGTYNVTLANAEADSGFTLGTDDTMTLSAAGAVMNISTGANAGQVNLDGRTNLYNGSTLNVTQGTTRLTTTSVLDGGTGTTKGTLNLTGSLQVNNPALANSPNITMNANSTTGNTTISATTGTQGITNVGTLTINGSSNSTVTIASSINNIDASKIVVNSGGTLMLGANEQISNTTNMTLNGGTFKTNGFSETLGTLTLTANSVIDLGSGTSVLNFESLNLNGFTLTVLNWNGTSSGYGTDQLLFRNPGSMATGTYVGGIILGTPTGNYYPGYVISHPQVGFPGAIEIVPEPSTYVFFVLLGMTLVGMEILRRRKKSQAA